MRPLLRLRYPPASRAAAAGQETVERPVVKRWPGILLLLCLSMAAPSPLSATAEKFSPEARWELYFSPQGGAAAAIIRSLDQARQSVLVQAYSFTSAPIAKALVAAHKRGVRVEVVLDKSQRTEKYSSADFLAHAGIKTYIDAAHAIAHNKVMIIDERIVITGSFNFTRAAEERNAENLLIIQDARLASLYLEDWRRHAAHSEPHTGRGEVGKPAGQQDDRWLDKVFDLLENQIGKIRKAP